MGCRSARGLVVLAMASVWGAANVSAELVEGMKHERVGSLEVLTWNVFLRPADILRDMQKERVVHMPQHLVRTELLVLAELFDEDAKEHLISALAATHPYVSRIAGGSKGRQHSGVVVLSQWPIEAQAHEVFADCIGTDCLADKAVVYVRVRKSARRYHVFATHLQAADAVVRGKQVQALGRFVASRAIAAGEAVVLAGDFNVRRGSTEFYEMLDVLNVFCPPGEGVPVTSDPRNDFVPDDRDGSFLDYVFYSKRHSRPRNAVLRTQIFQAAYAEGRRDLSDHYAVLGRLDF